MSVKLKVLSKVFPYLAAAGLGIAAASCNQAPSPEPKHTDQPSASSTWQGPVPPDQRPPRPAEGVEFLEGCPTNKGIIVDIYHGMITKSSGDNRVGKEATFVLRWVNDRKRPEGGCWQQTGFASSDADERLDGCNIEGIKTDGGNWPSCMKDSSE